MSSEHPSDSPDGRGPAKPRAARPRRSIDRAEAARILTAAAEARPQDLPATTVALHGRLLRHGPARRTRQRWDTASAALIAAASVDAAAEPVITALRLAGTVPNGDAPPPPEMVAAAREAVAVAAGWAWCALFCQLPDDADAFRWAAGACRATQRALARDDETRIGTRIDGAVGQACRSLVAAAAAAGPVDPDRHPRSLPPARLATAIGGLGAAFELLAALE